MEEEDGIRDVGRFCGKEEAAKGLVRSLGRSEMCVRGRNIN